jgi:hypothetical protein
MRLQRDGCSVGSVSLGAYAMVVRTAPTLIASTIGGFFRVRPTIYIMILLTAVVAPFLYKLRTESIFSCQAHGYDPDRFLTYCEAPTYSDYEHGAFWFDLEPAAQTSAANADVLFLGNSRVSFAFSTNATVKWFSSVSATYYLLGFIGFENSIFERALLHRLKPRAEVYVINIPEFFQPSEAPFAKAVLNDDAARIRYREKRLVQFVHKPICISLPIICGHALAIFQSRRTGMWYMPDRSMLKGRERPVSYDQQIDEREIDDAIAIGHTFLSELPVRPECVILTAVPAAGTRLNAANTIASGLGKRLVIPQHVDELQTLEGDHLDPASAERWSEAFFKAAGPQIQKCLATTARDYLGQSPHDRR